MTNRVHIDAPSGIIDIEGEKDFVEGMLSKLFPVIERIGFGSRPQAHQATTDLETDASTDDNNSGSQQNEKTSIRRRRGSAPPKGHSCADRIISLRGEKFFQEKRGLSDIVAGLGSKGWTHNINQVSAATDKMFKRGVIQRTKEGKGPWKYFWDRD